MDIIHPLIEKYCDSTTSSESTLLHELNRKTHVKMVNPRMLSGHYQGRLLSILSKMIRPKRILEIGTYTGYSSLCLAEGLPEDGLLFTIDVNEELEEFTASFFQKSPYKNQLKFLIGNALELIPTLDEEFDLVFIDADKRNYPAYYELVLPKVRKGGFILSDNVLWSGKVVEDSSTFNLDTQIIDGYNKMIQEDERVENILLPIRDGIMIAQKR
jgi:predicted O-methyltransferase YrrM